MLVNTIFHTDAFVTTDIDGIISLPEYFIQRNSVVCCATESLANLSHGLDHIARAAWHIS